MNEILREKFSGTYRKTDKGEQIQMGAEHFVLSSFQLPAAWGEEGIAKAKKAILNNVICSNLQ